METVKHYTRLWDEAKANYSGKFSTDLHWRNGVVWKTAFRSGTVEQIAFTVRLDPRTVDFFMMSSPIPSALICLGYLVVVAVGPKLMANRPAFNVRQLLLVYNFAMVILSGYLFVEVSFPNRCWLSSIFSYVQFAAGGWFNGYTLGCQPVDYSRSPTAMRVRRSLFSRIRWHAFLYSSRWLTFATCFSSRNLSNYSTRYFSFWKRTFVRSRFSMFSIMESCRLAGGSVFDSSQAVSARFMLYSTHSFTFSCICTMESLLSVLPIRSISSGRNWWHGCRW